jgi:hypothetical protein
MKSKPWIGWHFLPQDKRLRWGTKEKVREGKVSKVKGELKVCEFGLHASKRPVDALRYAPGPIVCKVLLRGEILEEEDKACATERKVLAIADATEVLHKFACWCATNALKAERKAGREPDKRSWDAIKTKLAWLAGKATVYELSAAGAAAGAAARDAAGDAARAAAWAAAGAAAWDAARAAARDAAGAAARDAAWAAARDAAWAAAWDAAGAAAWAAARDAAWDAQNKKLTRMFNRLLRD